MSTMSDRVAIVTGAAEGLGRAIVDRLVGDGFRVVANDISAAIENSPGAGWPTDRIRTVVADIAAVDTADMLVETALSEFGRIDAFVNNAGVAGPSATLEDLSVEDLMRVFTINVVGSLRLCQAGIPHLKRQRSGRIVNVGSLFADQPVPEAGAYCVSKAAVRSLSEVLALELGEFGITVNTVAPGLILTSMHRGAIAAQAARLGVTAEQRERDLREGVPLQRHGVPADIAGAVAWLLSDDASYVTGQTIGVNGGLLFR